MMSNWKHIGFRNKSLRNEPRSSFNGSDLKVQREKLSLTQRELAIALCVSVRTVIAWETGTRNMPLCCQRLFCMLYGLPFSIPTSPVDELHPDLFED